MSACSDLLLQVASDDVEKLLDCHRIQGIGVPLGIDKVRADMVLDHLGHKTGHCAPDARDEVEHLLAARFAFQGALDCLDLTLQAPDPGEQLLLLSYRMHRAEMDRGGAL